MVPKLSAKRILVYALLVAGSMVFSLPFLWMATTSTKVDRELFGPGLDLFPECPNPRLQSPYIDGTRILADVEPPPAEILAGLEELVRVRLGERVPEDVRDRLWAENLALAASDKLSRALPREVWEQGAGAVLTAAPTVLNDRVLEELFERVHFRLCIGQVRVRDERLQEEVLGGGVPLAERLVNRTPDVATLTGMTDRGGSYVSVAYDFGSASEIVLSNTFNVGFDPGALQRLQLHIKPDDTWHELDIVLEAAGKRYVGERPFPLANDTWATVTWQRPGPDDHSTKIKTWVLLQEDVDAVEVFDVPGQLRLTFRVTRSSFLGALGNKLAMNYIRVLDHIPFWRYVQVSLFLVIVNVVLTVFACSLVAYAFARLQWPGREFCFLLMLATLMIPGQVTMIPHFLIWRALGMYNTLFPLWFGRLFGNAFFIFLLRQFLRGVPRDLEDAARIDGCGTLRIYWHLMLPLMKPSLAAIAIFTFMGTWNDFMGPLIYIADQRLYPLAFGLYAFAVQVGNNPALTMAGSLLMTVPVIVIFFFAQKYFIQGVTLTGMKG